jgi:hypothetical protein
MEEKMRKVTKTLIRLLPTLFVGILISCASKPAPEPPPVADVVPPPPPLVADVVLPPPPPPAPVPTGGTLSEINARYRPFLNTAGATTHTVVYRNTLAGIAIKIWGRENGYHFPLIMLASGELITDPDLIFPGQRLTIPSLRANLDNPATRAQIKLYLGEVAGWYEREHPQDKKTPAGLRALAAKL